MSESGNMFRSLTGKLRTLFCSGDLVKRNADGSVQVKTHNGVSLRDKKEAFPYGFVAKAKSGKTLVFCQGGNRNDFEILPVMKGDGIVEPELEDGDVAVYTAEGGRVVLRDDGGVEIVGGKGKLLLANDAADLCKAIVGLIDDIKGTITNGSPTSQTISEPTKAKFDARQKEFESLLAEAK